MKLSFETKDGAVSFLREKVNRGMLKVSSDGKYFWDNFYVLNNNEYDCPDYRVRKYKDGWGISVTYHYYNKPKTSRILEDIWG